MWKCPKCGRQFRNENQPHYCGEKPETVEEYIRSFDPEVQSQLESVRECIRAAVPDAVEKISWSMPTYWNGHNIIHFAAQKKHIGLYPGPEAVEHFAPKLEEAHFRYSKGSIQIPYSESLPLSLIQEIAKWCYFGGEPRENSAVSAMKYLQDQFKGETEGLGIESEQDVMNLMKSIRDED